MISEEVTQKVTEVLIAHPSVPNYSSDQGDRHYVCPSCPDALVDGPNSPSHARHQAEVLAEAGLLAPAPLNDWEGA